MYYQFGNQFVRVSTSLWEKMTFYFLFAFLLDTNHGGFLCGGKRDKKRGNFLPGESTAFTFSTFLDKLIVSSL